MKPRRSRTSPLGDPNVPSCRAANIIVSRVAILAALAHSRHVYFAVEQPMSSLMPRHPRMEDLATRLGSVWQEVRFWMGNYGHFSPKPSKVFGTACPPRLASHTDALRVCAVCLSWLALPPETKLSFLRHRAHAWCETQPEAMDLSVAQQAGQDPGL